MKFKVGDVVVITNSMVVGNSYLHNGDIGTVVHDGWDATGVDWHKDIHGNDCDGKCEHGHGWFADAPYIDYADYTLNPRRPR